MRKHIPIGDAAQSVVIGSLVVFVDILHIAASLKCRLHKGSPAADQPLQ
jgi:hypothetical protein